MAEMEVSPQGEMANPQGMKVFAVERHVLPEDFVEMRIFSTLPNHVWKQGHGSTAEK